MISSRLVRWSALLTLLVCEISPAQALMRVPNTTLSVPLETGGGGFAVEEALGTLNFTRPVGILSPPGETNRLFILEKQGIISVVTNLASPTRTVFLDIDARVVGGTSDNSEQGLLGMAFHPGYATNRQFYVFYTRTNSTASLDVLSRFTTLVGNPNQGDIASEQTLFAQFDEAGNHNGGDLHFGPDGYLYVALGDEGGGNDQYINSQRIDQDLFAGILRLDVDKRPGSVPPNPHPAVTTNYAVPADNPFVGATQFNAMPLTNLAAVRTEFWAVGLRNPWRMSFDPATGQLLCGDVGQSAREEINRIVKGGNYGWAFREGFLTGPKWAQAPINWAGIEPLLDYPRGTATNQGTVVIGGVTYRGTRLPQLFGAYIFADAASGNVWSLRHDGTNATAWNWLASQFGISTFGTDPRNGDVLMAAQSAGRIRRLVAATNAPPAPLPPTLADTGAFSDLASLTPHAGVVPYAINTPFWSDHAGKRRWFSVPDTNQSIGFSAAGNWAFPTGTVWIKHFELELTNGVPGPPQRLETRLLVKNAAGVHGFTYRWGASATNATLVPAAGLDETFIVNQGGGVLRTQVWHYPARSECLACHTAAGGHAAGFNTAQLNRSGDLGAGPEAQIAALAEAGYFSGAVSNFNLLPRMPDLADEGVSREHRVRALFAANCAGCHAPGGNAPSLWDGRFATQTPLAGIIDGALLNTSGGVSNKVVARGAPELSAALQRMSVRGPGQMPPLGTSLVDTQAVALLLAWITNDLPAYQTFGEWQVARFGATNAPGAGVNEDFDLDGDIAFLEFLNGTDPKLGSSLWRPAASLQGTNILVGFERVAGRGYEVQFTDTLTVPGSWTPLNVPSNAPVFPAGNTWWTVPDPLKPEGARHYRVRVFER